MHKVSPLKDSKGVNAFLQQKDGFCDVVCYKPELHQQLRDFETNRQGIYELKQM